MADRISWLVLLYRIPSEPSRLRAAVWRRLKAAGAVYLAGSVAALPASPAAERSLRRLRHDVCDMGGSAQLLRAEALAGQPDVISAFNAAPGVLLAAGLIATLNLSKVSRERRPRRLSWCRALPPQRVPRGRDEGAARWRDQRPFRISLLVNEGDPRRLDSI